MAKIGITVAALSLSACSASGSGSPSPNASTSTAPSSSPTSPAPSTSTVQASSSLDSLVVATPTGFKSEMTDMVSGGPTGSIGLNEATSADCDSGQVLKDHWVASELRYFDDDPKYATAYLILCVTQLGSPADAAANQAQVVALTEHPLGGFPALRRFSVSHVPGAVGVFVDSISIVQVFFAKGPYFVFVAGAALSQPGRAAVRGLANDTAIFQYEDLPA